MPTPYALCKHIQRIPLPANRHTARSAGVSPNKMQLRIPTEWVEITEGQFFDLTANLNLICEAFCGGEYYAALGFGKQRMERGLLQQGQTRIGLHTDDGRYFVDPKFFNKPSPPSEQTQSSPAPTAAEPCRP